MSDILVVHCKKEEFDVYIGRPSKWGNPFSHKNGTKAKFKVATRQEAVESFEKWLKTQPKLMNALPELKGKVLGCWCAPLACHGDVLSRLANHKLIKADFGPDAGKNLKKNLFED